MTTVNPYAAPKAAVADETVVTNADFVPGGQKRPAGNGWTWIAEGWELFKRQPGLWIGMTLLIFIMFFALGLLPFVGGLVSTLLWPIFLAGLAIGCRTLDQGGEMELGHLFAGFRDNVGTLIGIGALVLAATFAVILLVFAVMGVGLFGMMGGGDPEAAMQMGVTILLAGLISLALLLPVMMAAWFAPLLVAFHGFGAWEAIRMSFRACLRNILPFLIYGLALLVLGLLALIPLGLGLLIVWPVAMASVYASYKDIYLKPRP
jgi:uncharacterized membrane protein